MKNFLLLCGVGLLVVCSLGADVQVEDTFVDNGYKITEIRRDENLKKPFHINSVTTNSSGQLQLKLDSLDTSPSDLATEIEGQWTGEIQNSDSGEEQDVTLTLKKRCVCGDGSGYIKCPKCTCPENCTEVEWILYISKAPGPGDEMIFGRDPDFLYLVEPVVTE